MSYYPTIDAGLGIRTKFVDLVIGSKAVAFLKGGVQVTIRADASGLVTATLPSGREIGRMFVKAGGAASGIWIDEMYRKSELDSLLRNSAAVSPFYPAPDPKHLERIFNAQTVR